MWPSFWIGELTDVDRAAVDAWLERAERDLEGIAVGPLRRTVETGSVVQLEARFRPGTVEVPAAITLYRDVGRVRIQVGAGQVPQETVEQLESWLAYTLELTVVARSDPRSEAKVLAALAADRGPAALRPEDGQRQ